MTISRREFTRLLAGGGAAAAMSQLSRTASMAAAANGPYRAMVGVFLFGGNDGWNMVVPTDGRYAAYAAARNPALVLASVVMGALSPATLLAAPLASMAANSTQDEAQALLLGDGALLVIDEQGTLELPRASKLTLARQLMAEIASRISTKEQV